MTFYFSILVYCGLFFIFQASGKVNLIGSTKVKRGWNKYGWVLGEPSECSASCGEGTQTSKYDCRMLNSQNIVPSYYCIHSKMPEPLVKACANPSCQPVWLVSDWSACNASCGFGTKRRRVRCGMRGSDGVSTFVLDKFCAAIKPSSQKVCQEELCRHWRSEQWSKCSVTCGHGYSHRKVVCVAENPNLCPISKKPKLKKICYQGPCLDINIDQESKETADKKEDEEELKLKLYDLEEEDSSSVVEDYGTEDDSEDVYVDNNSEFRKKFNGAPPKEENEETARQPSITPSIEITTSTNATNTPTRTEGKTIKNFRYIQNVECNECSLSLMIADDQSIVYLLHNSTLNLVCNNEDDESIFWYRNDAVVSRRQVFQLRRVTHLDSGIYICFRNSRISKVSVSVILQANDLQSIEKQIEKKTLNLHEAIYIAATIDFNQHFPISYGLLHPPPFTNNNFFLEQEIICYVSNNIFFMLLDVSLCDKEKVNNVPYVIGDIPAYKWEHTEWSECSSQCVGNGVGKRTREVWCQSPAGHRVDDFHCEENKQVKMVSEIYCPKDACLPHWQAGPYSQCEGMCGRFGQRNRQVECVWGADVVVEETLCEGQDRPSESTKCMAECEGETTEESCVDAEGCKEVEPAERCNEKNKQICCATCRS